MTKVPNESNYAGIVKSDEMQDARLWLADMLAALTEVGEADPVRPEIVCVSQGWGALQMGVSVAKTPLCLAGKFYAFGLGTHADSEIVVRLPVGARRLTGWCGVNDSPDTRRITKPLVFSVEVDGRDVWRSGPQDASSAPAQVDASLAGRRQFKLKVQGPISYAHANWAELKVTLANGQFVKLGRSATVDTGFSFKYGGKPSVEFLKTWPMKKQRLPEKDGVILHRIVRTDSKTGLAVICEIKEYTRFPVLEWGLRLKNTSQRNTPVIENIQALDVTPQIGPLPYLNHWTGDYNVQDGYEPFRVSLAHEEEYRFAPVGGRPTDRAWPYYNLECPTTQRGMIVVVGWAGQWASRFQASDTQAVHITAGQELTHFKLLPGEEVRTPLSVLMFYRGDQVRSQNIWRRWMLAHNLPRPGGRLPEPMLPAYTGRWFEEMGKATEETQNAFMDRYVEEGIKLDYWWMDAGWYPCDGVGWPKTGTWEPDAKRFPRGLRAVSDHAHAQGIKTLVWFEPERVYPDTWLCKERPQWLLSVGKSANRLLDLGNPAALKWLIKHVARTIREQGIDLYRQDFNFAPLPYWRGNDAPDRQGITEIRHVEGYLAYWTALRKRFPDMLIDSCASGGRRNDLETMRLSVPLHKTDYLYDDLPAKQAFHHTLSSWLPYYGAYVLPTDTAGDMYSFRSALAPMTLLTHDLRRRDVDWRPLKQLTEEWRRVTSAEYFYGDYYPLTPYNRDDTQWIAWQYHRPDTGQGLVQAFRRKDSQIRTMLFRLGGLDPVAQYDVTDMDQPGKSVKHTGEELMTSGLLVEMKQSPQAMVIVYEQSKP